MIEVPDFANTDIATIFQYINALEMENKSRNEERIFLQGEISQLKLQLSFFTTNYKQKSKNEKQLEKQVSGLKDMIVKQKQEIIQLQNALSQQKSNSAFLDQKVKKLTYDLSKPIQIIPPSFFNSKPSSIEISQRSISIDRCPKKSRNQALQSTVSPSKRDLFQDFQAKITNRITAHYETKSKREIQEIKNQKDSQIHKLKQQVADMAKKVKRQEIKSARFEKLYKQCNDQKKIIGQKYEQKIKQIEERSNYFQKHHSLWKNKKMKSLCIQIQKQKSQENLVSCFRQDKQGNNVEFEQTKQKLKQLTEELAKSEESKAKSRQNSYQIIHTLEKIIQSKQSMNTKLLTDNSQLRAEIQQLREKKDVPPSPKVDDLESSTDLDFPSFREEALKIMREMEIEILQKNYEIQYLKRENKKMKESCLKTILQMGKCSQERQKLISAQGQIAFLKAKLQKYERGRNKPVIKTNFNDYGYTCPPKNEDQKPSQALQCSKVWRKSSLNMGILGSKTKDSSSQSDSQRR